jgi:tripartite-type tricarboxylate transporter receptor subunit TctC
MTRVCESQNNVNNQERIAGGQVMMNRRRFALGGILGMLSLNSQLSQAQSAYPNRVIRLVVPFPAGGATDVVARFYANVLGRQLGQEVMVENKVGASGASGTADVARSRPDGYSLVFGTATTHALHSMVAKVQQYDAIKDFAPIALIGSAPLVFVATPGLGGDLQAVLAQARANPGKMNYGSPGHGTFMHLAAERLKQAADNADITHVAYRGSGPAMNDLIGGHIALIVDTVATALPQHRAGSARILAIASEQRLPLAPDIPTIDEAMGMKGFAAALWNVVAVPAATPPDIVERLNAATLKILADPAFVAKMTELGVEAARPTTPKEARDYVIAEQARWKPVVDKAGIVQE